MRDEFIAKQDAVGVIEKEMKNYVSDIWYKSATHSALNDVNENIKSLEPADVVRVVHAHWRDTGSGQECSACKEIQYGYDTGRHYCPNCGAIMDGKGEE